MQINALSHEDSKLARRIKLWAVWLEGRKVVAGDRKI